MSHDPNHIYRTYREDFDAGRLPTPWYPDGSRDPRRRDVLIEELEEDVRFLQFRVTELEDELEELEADMASELD